MMIVTKRFNPKKQTDLKPDYKTLVGKTIRVYDGWEVESGSYKGQRAWILVDFPFGWVPTEDIEDGDGP